VSPQTIVFTILGLTLALFITGRLRHDAVSLVALLVAVFAGVVAPEDAFSGFGHPAVITVAAVLVISRGLLNAGLVDVIAQRVVKVGDNVTLQIAALAGLAAAASAFMNNVGALALLLPVALRMARSSGTPPSRLLMPLAFGSLLGGMTTLIGTPPNIIIATARGAHLGTPFRMFDFTPVGAVVAVAGLAFIALVGWRLLPVRKGQASREDLFEIEEYIAEVVVPKDSGLAGKMVRDLEAATEAEVMIVGLVRGERKQPAPSPWEPLREGDVLIVEADPEALQQFVDDTKLELAGTDKVSREALGSDQIGLVEAVVAPDSPIAGRTARSLDLRWRHGLNLLAIARGGARLKSRVGRTRFEPGDVLLMQGDLEHIHESLPALGCLPLAERGLRLGQPRRILLSMAIFGTAIGLAALGALPVQIAFTAAAVLLVLSQTIPLREVYQAVDWPVIVLLGALIPVGGALERTGGAESLATALLSLAASLPPAATLAILLVGTMFLSDLVNNAAAAVLMAPIAISVANGLGASPDPFLMAVAIGASCAFLTPIGHQSNTLVLGPGGYRFGDYWRLGLPLEIVIAVVAVPLILVVWPL
jgi:di/tricarboxylate transporter